MKLSGHNRIAVLASILLLSSFTRVSAVGVIPHPEDPYHPDAPGSFGYHGPDSSGSGIDSGSGSTSGGLAAHGTSLESTNPLGESAGTGRTSQSGESESENEELIEKILEAAKDVLDQISSAIDNALSSSSATSAANVPATAALGRLVSATQTATAGNPTDDGSLPSLDIATALAHNLTLGTWSDAITPDEWDMYINDPLCYFANLEAMYTSALTANATATTNSPQTTSAPSRNKLRADRRQDDSDCITIAAVTACPLASGTPEYTSSIEESLSSVSSVAYTLYASAVPNDLWSLHFASATTPSGAKVTGTATSVTTCSGLDGKAGVTTRYRVLQTPSTTTSSPSGGGPTGAAAAISWSRSLMFGAVGPIAAALFL